MPSQEEVLVPKPPPPKSAEGQWEAYEEETNYQTVLFRSQYYIWNRIIASHWPFINNIYQMPFGLAALSGSEAGGHAASHGTSRLTPRRHFPPATATGSPRLAFCLLFTAWAGRQGDGARLATPPSRPPASSAAVAHSQPRVLLQPIAPPDAAARRRRAGQESDRCPGHHRNRRLHDAASLPDARFIRKAGLCPLAFSASSCPCPEGQAAFLPPGCPGYGCLFSPGHVSLAFLSPAWA